jgi:pimeloyl-ACP methyl ester carboxylesterase
MEESAISQSKGPTFILVHGAWYGSFAWKKITPLLEAKGYRVITLDLPGYGIDKQPLANITLDDYVKKVADIANSFEEKVILVGHSMGGAVITQVSELLGPDKVAKLIFLDAFLLKNGESILSQVDKMNEASKDPENLKARKLVTNFLVISKDQKCATVPPDRMVDVFCHDCPAEDQALINRDTIWQPLAVLAAPVNVTDKHYGVIPKFFIQCTLARDLDRTSILQNVTCRKIYTLPSSHSPFFSMPDKLASILEDIYNDSAVAVSQ